MASDLARVLATLVRERPGGLWHVANTGTTTWFDVAHYIGEILGAVDGFATAIATADLDPTPLATRPIRSDLSIREVLITLVGAPGLARGTDSVDP